MSPLIGLMALALAMLACGFIETRPGSLPNRVVILTRLPTFTPTPLVILTPTAQLRPTAAATRLESAPSVSVTAAAPVTPEPAAGVPTLTPTPWPSFTSTPATAAIEISEPSGTAQTSTTGLSPATVTTLLTNPINRPTGTVPVTESPTPTPIPPATPTTEPKIDTPGWDVAGLRLSTDQDEERVVLYGDLINNTGSAQEIAFITGTFYDPEGQMMANPERVIDSWPIDVIVSGGQMPFELTFLGTQSVANLVISVEASPSGQSLRQDFEFSDLDQWTEPSGDYCLRGKVQHSGNALQQYLVVIVVLYDGQDNIINFGEEGGPPPSLLGEETMSFVICDQTLNQQVARYELRAWGR